MTVYGRPQPSSKTAFVITVTTHRLPACDSPPLFRKKAQPRTLHNLVVLAKPHTHKKNKRRGKKHTSFSPHSPKIKNAQERHQLRSGHTSCIPITQHAFSGWVNTAALNNQTTSPSDSRKVNSQTNVKPSGVVANPEQNNNFAVRHGNPAPAKSQPPFNETLAGQQKGQRKHWDQSPNNDATASLLTGQLVTTERATTREARRPRQARTGLLHSEEK